MKVAYLLRYFPTLTEGFVVQEACAAQAAGEQVRVFGMDPREDGALRPPPSSLDHQPVPRRPLRRVPDTPGARWLAKHQRPKDLRRWAWWCQAARTFDVVQVHFAGEAAEWAHALRLDRGPPWALTVHANDLFRPRASLADLLSGADGVATVCDHHARVLAGLGVQARVIRCGPDLAFWAPTALPTGALKALCVARDVPKKGLDVLIQAWSQLSPGPLLTLVSDRSAAPLPAGVRALPLQTPDKTRALLAQANLAVLACQPAEDGDLDGVPLVLMEAMAMGRPVVSTALSGIPELVDDAVGWLVPPADPGALGRALAQAQSPQARAIRGAAGPARLRARRFSLVDQVAGIRQLWALISGTAPTP